MGCGYHYGNGPGCGSNGCGREERAGEYVVLTGNQSGALMVHYLLDAMKAQGALPANGAVIKTIVTSELGQPLPNHTA